MKPNNQPAFPVIHPAGLSHQGMSLRDYFAAKAMQVALQKALHNFGVDGLDGPIDADHIADSAYDLADAMLAAREK